MNPDSPMKLVSDLLDLPLLDQEGVYCGIVDDIELAGRPGRALQLKALLVGPGAYAGRLPRWAMAIVATLAGDSLTRVPMEKVRSINSAVHLDCPARDLGLQKAEAVARRLIPRRGAL